VPTTTTLPSGWTWTRLLPNGAAGAPPAREDATVVWDPDDRELLVYGGANTASSTALSDLWAYRPATGAWTQLVPTNTAPPGRFGAAGVWDPIGKRLLLFGGQAGAGGGAAFRGDVQAYSPAANTWTTLAPGGASGDPTARSRASLVWDNSAGRLLLFGGETVDSPLTLVSDLWSFTPSASGGSWTLLDGGNRADSPPARDWAPAAWDPPAGALRLFGGKNAASSTFSDTWEWTAANGWRFDEARQQPAGRGAAAFAWDATHTHFLVGPGLALNGNAADTWAYEPSTGSWIAQGFATATTPALRQMTSMAWDDADGQGLLFGGRVSGMGDANDLWALVPTTMTTAPTPSPTPAAVRKALDVGMTVDPNGNLLITSRQVDEVATAGAAYVRLSFNLGASTSWTPALLNTYGQVVTMFQRAGVGVIGLVSNGATADHNGADWTANNAETSGGDGDNPYISGTYTAALRTLTHYFHGPPYNVKLWELWNEPNVYRTCSGAVCSGASYLYPSNFAALLADSYQDVKVTDAITDVTLISGGVYGHGIGGAYTPTNAGAAYLTATYHMGVDVTRRWSTLKAQIGTYPLDAVGQHIYIDQSRYSTPAALRTYGDWLRGAYAAYEGAGTSKPTIVTEAGWTTGGTHATIVSPAQQAANVDALYWAAQSAPYLPLVTWFQVEDNPAADLYFGLYTSSGAAKASLARYQAH